MSTFIFIESVMPTTSVIQHIIISRRIAVHFHLTSYNKHTPFQCVVFRIASRRILEGDIDYETSNKNATYHHPHLHSTIRTMSSSSANTKAITDVEPPHEEKEDDVGVGQQAQDAETNRSKSMLRGGEIPDGKDQNGHVQQHEGDNSKDFVVRDGFPALRLPIDSSAVDKDGSTTTNNNSKKAKKNVWWIDGDEPIPRTSFWAQDECFQFNEQQLPGLLRDAKRVFSARTRQPGQAYSTGTTYFCPCLMKPRCALEAMALLVFQRHTQHLADGVVIPEQSGAEWWTLVLNDGDESNSNSKNNNSDDDIHKGRTSTSTENNDHNSAVEGKGEESLDDDDDDDEVGLHFDADYGLEDQVPNLLLHPRLATVTYLTGAGGAPTVVFDCPSPHSQQRQPEQNSAAAAKAKSNSDKSDEDEDDDDAIMMSWHGTSVRKAWISHPKVGKHIAFDGRLLHGAPATFFPAADAACDEKEVKPPAAKRAKRSNNENEQAENLHHEKNQRITFLVNIWINHCPLEAEPLEDEICEQLETPWDWWSPPTQPSLSEEKKADSGTNADKKQNGETKEVAATTNTPAFTWNEDIHFDKPPLMESAKIQKWSSIKDDDGDDRQQLLEPAGEEEVVICNRLVTIKYESTMNDLHQATKMTGLVEMNFDEGALVIQVGEKVEEFEEEEDDDDDDECGNDTKEHGDRTEVCVL
jgi:hypothetical protein